MLQLNILNDFLLPIALLDELSRGEITFTVPLLNYLLTAHPDLAAGLPIIRETLISDLIAYPDVLLGCLANPSIADKTVMLETAGELKFEEAAPALIALLGGRRYWNHQADHRKFGVDRRS